VARRADSARSARRADSARSARRADSARSARRASPARLLIALSVAAVLAVFLLYTSIAGGGNPSIRPSQLQGHTGKVQLAGKVVGPVRGDAHASGLTFALRDVEGSRSRAVRVLYTGSVPDLFRAGRDIVVDGRLRNGTFVAEPGSMITKCPSKYSPKKSGDS
jgi:cytochrome c-type biogenesis protein CcmE